MTVTFADETALKDMMKQVLVEVIQEQPDLIYDLVSEVLEDIALRRAIDEGMGSGLVSREEVFRLLEGED